MVAENSLREKAPLVKKCKRWSRSFILVGKSQVPAAMVGIVRQGKELVEKLGNNPPAATPVAWEGKEIGM